MKSAVTGKPTVGTPTAPGASGNWSSHAQDLASFVLDALFIRPDAFGEFLLGKRGVTMRESPSQSLLEDHFRDTRCIGPHTTSDANESLFGALDLDADHDPDNCQIALQLAQHLRDQGFAPLVEESRENRFHIWVRFPSPVPTPRLFALLRTTARIGTELGLKKVETFPKQAALRDDEESVISGSTATRPRLQCSNGGRRLQIFCPRLTAATNRPVGLSQSVPISRFTRAIGTRP
jgi:hypothetical protein